MRAHVGRADAGVTRVSPLRVAIRRARVEDAPLLAAAEREIARTPGFLVSRPPELTDAKFAAKIAELATAENGCYLVASHEGALVGHAMLDPLGLETVRHVAFLTLAVHPGSQGQGVGRALLGELVAWARSAPALEKIELNVRAGNTAALALYRAMGFEEEGRKKRRLKIGPGQYLDDIVMGLWVK